MGIFCRQHRRTFVESKLDHREGFALVLSLALLSLALLVALSAAALLSAEMAACRTTYWQARAKLNAVAAGRMALGELQTWAGRDRVATAPGREGNGWVSAVRRMDGGAFPRTVPLVSGGIRAKEIRENVLLAASENGHPAVRAPVLRDAAGGGFAFWVMDEAQKIDVGTRRESLSEKDRRAWAMLAGADIPLEELWKTQRPDVEEWRRLVARAESWQNLLLVWRQGADAEENFPDWRTHTRASRGVLANTAEGGLRLNWDRREELSAEEIPLPAPVWERFVRPDVFPERGWSVNGLAEETALRRFPVLAGLRTRFGFFNTRSDGYHRTRFNSEVQLWNPWPYPLVCTDGARLGLLEWEKLPRVTVTNLHTGGVIEADMSAFPSGRFGLARQTVSDTTANAWVELYDGRRYGMDAPGLLAGEVFRFAVPNPVAQPQGLSRVLSGTTWKMQTDLGKPGKPPSGANGAHWFHATHRIRIAATMPEGGATVHIREARGNFSGSQTAKEYAPAVLTLKNIPFEDFSFELSGAEYNRATSASYTAEVAQVAFTLQMRTDDPALLEEVLDGLDPRAPVLDFHDPLVRKLYRVEVLPPAALGVVLPASAAAGWLWDAAENDHENGLEAEHAFAGVRVVDFPMRRRPASAAALRHAPRLNAPAGALSVDYPRGREAEIAWLDRAFFAGKVPGTAAEEDWECNPWLEPRDTEEKEWMTWREAAAHCWLRGAFNVNCAESAAWRMLLARGLVDWRRRGAEESGEKMAGRNVVFRLPFGAEEIFPLGEMRDVDDAALRDLSAAARRRQLGGQGWRGLEEETADLLAAALARGVRAYQEKHGAFASLADFAGSGVVNTALAEAGIAAWGEEEISPLSPLRLNAGDLLESWMPALTVRGDTFTVRVEGNVQTADGRMVARRRAELTVQRFPEWVDARQSPMIPEEELAEENRKWGRRLRVVEWRWLRAEETE